ncbi:MAG: EI24 domain-containing protein [SAR324 cluster bacterium]|nr:EI24 domain-containing protein [SAR324 cluster bacterium]
MNEPEGQTKVKLQKTNALAVFRSGQQAFTEIEGLRGLVLRGLFLNYLIFFAATIILNWLFYIQVLSPFIDWLFGGGEGFWASVGTVVLWSIQLTVAAVISLAALRISVELMSFWHQNIVYRIIKNFRQIEETAFSLKAWLRELKYIFKEALKACLFPLLLLFVGLIPILGLPLVFLLEAHLLGRQSIVVYLESLTNPQEAVELRKSWRWLPIRIGWLAAILTFIPFAGWIFLPLTLTYEVVGFTFLVEKSRTS